MSSQLGWVSHAFKLIFLVLVLTDQLFPDRSSSARWHRQTVLCAAAHCSCAASFVEGAVMLWAFMLTPAWGSDTA
ncbi:hypothetical protein SRHO_G00080070 [Serrasalmus rhombeus]